MVRKYALAIILVTTSCEVGLAFAPPRLQRPIILRRSSPARRGLGVFGSSSSHPPTPYSSTSLPSYSFNKSSFDVLSLITVSERTLLQYNSTNQSEPLRIYLYLTLSVLLLFSGALGSALDVSVGPAAEAASRALGMGAAGLFVREAGFRRRQLKRIELEQSARALPITVGGRLGGVRETSVGGLDGDKRVLVVRGNGEELREVEEVARALASRWRTAGAVLLLCCTDGKAERGENTFSAPWLATVPKGKAEGRWDDFFEELLATGGEERSDSSSSSSSQSCWFGLNTNGRSFGSGLGQPDFLTVFGSSLRPTEFLSVPEEAPAPPASEVEAELLEAQSKFYAFLTDSGAPSDAETIFSAGGSPAVADVKRSGGRADPWSACLAPGARPASMSYFDAQAYAPSEDRAYTSNVEAPDPGRPFETLLALQRWRRDEGGGEWMLETHSTVPWNQESKAGGMLLCDVTGCVALTRGRK